MEQPSHTWKDELVARLVGEVIAAKSKTSRPSAVQVSGNFPELQPNTSIHLIRGNTSATAYTSEIRDPTKPGRQGQYVFGIVYQDKGAFINSSENVSHDFNTIPVRDPNTTAKYAII